MKAKGCQRQEIALTISTSAATVDKEWVRIRDIAATLFNEDTPA